MAGTNQFLPFATGSGANALTVAQYQALAARQGGFVAGIAKSIEVNTAIRQTSSVASMVGQFIADLSGNDANDDGNIAVLERRFRDALLASLAADAGASLVHFGLDISTSANLLNVQTVTPNVPSLIQGMLFEIVPLNSVTGPSVVVIGTNAAVSLFRRNGTPLVAGDIVAGAPFLAIFYGGSLRLLGLSSSEVTAIAAIGARTLDPYKTAGTYNWVCPANVYSIGVLVIGGGCSGAAGTSSVAGGGGGAGGSAEARSIPVVPGVSYVVQVGFGGARQATLGSPGLPGSASAFSTFISAPGAPSNFAGIPTGSPGGPQGTGGLLNLAGSSGGDGTPFNSFLGGYGGASRLGSGGRPGTIGGGTGGEAPGSGGGGSYGPNPGPSGNGADGCVLITY